MKVIVIVGVILVVGLIVMLIVHSQNKQSIQKGDQDIQGEKIEIVEGASEKQEVKEELSLSGEGEFETRAEQSASWYGEKTFVVNYSHTGNIDIQSADISIKDDMLVGGILEVNMGTITSDAGEKLNAHLQSDSFFSVEQYPTSTFTISSSSKSEDENVYTIVGDMTIKNTTRQIEVPARITMKDENTLHVFTTFDINRADFDIRFGSKKFFASLINEEIISDTFSITADLILEKK
ncbi:MAG: polyisoprenoid-binding protein YceI [Flavobacteriaceae bacterium]|jgi:polyisoprenoid-binding protein YceI